MKKLISLVLSIAIILSVCSVAAFAQAPVVADGKTYDIKEGYPYVFVHGMGGWGPDYEEMPYWGGWADSEGNV